VRWLRRRSALSQWPMILNRKALIAVLLSGTA
jgi:hypothetical protein